MRKQPKDHYGAFNQILILFTVISWITFLYFIYTGKSEKFFHVNNYGNASIGILNTFTTFIVAILFTFLLFVNYRKSKNKKM
jgi:hypothetical protein